MKVLIISGKAGSGKTFLAERIKETYERMYGLRVAILAYADPLKMVAHNIYGWNGEKGPSGRALLQRLGTDIVQKNHQNCWVHCIANIMMGLDSEFDLFIISDARFVHELEVIEGLLPPGTEIITIRIDGKTSLDGELSQHSSETQLDDYPFDYYFPNEDYTPTVFFFNLFTLIKRLEGQE